MTQALPRSSAAGFVRLAGVAAIASQLFLLGNGLTALVAADLDIGFASELRNFVALDPDRIVLMRTSFALDIVAYLLWVPLILVLRDAFDTPSAKLAAVSGLTYVIPGAVGAAVLIGAWPPLIRAYAAGADAEAARVTFAAITDAVYHGVWNIVCVVGLGTWLVLTGIAMRGRNRSLGALAIAAGAAAFTVAALRVVGAGDAAKIALGATGALAPLWGMLIGVSLVRRPNDWAPGRRGSS